MNHPHEDHTEVFLRQLNQFEPRIRSFVRSLIPSFADASDVMQEVLVIIWEKIEQCPSGVEFLPWGLAIAKFQVMAHWRDLGIEIKPNLQRIIRPESVGGTSINRMIHRESNQLIIGSYFIDASGNVRFLPPQQLPGRLCGTARHLLDPANKVYFATMDKGFYEVNVNNLEVFGIIKDYALENIEDCSLGSFGDRINREHRFEYQLSQLSGQNGMGCYTTKDRVFFANAGQTYEVDLFDLKSPAGAIGQWKGAGDWELVRQNQFTEITGPGGICGATNPNDPIWTIGWDHRSLILMVYDQDKWTAFRLPKGTHCADGIHGTTAGWPRIRDIGKPSLLMNMHGTFWKFPRTFSSKNTAGIEPLSNYLKDIGDFCAWNDQIVFGCNDTAVWSLNDVPRPIHRPGSPGVSQSNLWFVTPNQLNSFGPLLGHGALWIDDNLTAGDVSDPYLFSGYAFRTLHLKHDSNHPLTLSIEVDEKGSGEWKLLRQLELQPFQYQWVRFEPEEKGAWIRIRAEQPVEKMTAYFEYSNTNLRNHVSSHFQGMARSEDKKVSGGLLQPQVTSRPELANHNAIGKEEAEKIAETCRKHGITIVPLVNLLGHQSWDDSTGKLLQMYPEFNETPEIKPQKLQWPNPDGYYCLSYCPLHPGVHEMVFPLVDEILRDFQASHFHAGMDEVFYLGHKSCPRCQSKNKAELFSGEVTKIHDHLAKSDVKLWIWGDRLIDGEATGVGEWEGSCNETAPAIGMIPKDVMVCDWHYDRAETTAPLFAAQKLNVVSCFWKKPKVTSDHIEAMKMYRKISNDQMASQYRGVVQTVWSGTERFLRDYYDSNLDESKESEAASFKQMLYCGGKKN